ncbi:acyl-CoA dehydrogenase family member 10-like isoform X1 [Osmerus mordax]|uniref:acyl-CoA dehydrogenase family member 10-like isoform X1 n=1 Tax=Osmerus mordax TaxID=8014 RepID=UPI00350F989F
MMVTKPMCLLRPAVLFGARRWHLQTPKRQLSRTPTCLYKAVIFDMYGVLLPSPVKIFSVFEQQNAVPQGTLGRVIREGGELNVWDSYMRGELDAQEFVEAFSKQCSDIAGCPVPIDSLMSALTSGPMQQPMPVMMEAIECMRSRGLKTAVLSNNFLTLDKKSYMPLNPALFDVIVESCREGLTKPDARIFQLCLHRLGVSAQEAVFLDDLQFNVQAAADLGMTSIKVEEPEAAVGNLEEVLGFPLSLSGTSRRTSKPFTDQHTQYLRTHLQLDDTNIDVQSLNPSQSLHFITSRGRNLLLRTQLLGSKALGTEHRLLKALSGSGLPIPKIIDYCEDPSLGGPFLLMEICPGRRFTDPSLPGLAPTDRTALYQAMTSALCQLHRLDTTLLDLEGKDIPVESLGVQVERWIHQYKTFQTQSIPAVNRLMDWLLLHLPKDHSTTLVHGDFRLSNLVFHPERAEVVGVLDWGSAVLGDPLLDITSLSLTHHLPQNHPLFPGLGGLRVDQLGIPRLEDLIHQYCSTVGMDPPPHLQFYMALQLFRLACRQQGTEQLAELGWDFATKEGFRIFNAMPREQTVI